MNFHFVPPVLNALQRPTLNSLVAPGHLMMPTRPIITGIPQNRCLVPEKPGQNLLNNSLLSTLLVRPPAMFHQNISSMASAQTSFNNHATSVEVSKTVPQRQVLHASFDVPPPNFVATNSYPAQHPVNLPNQQPSLQQPHQMPRMTSSQLQQPSHQNNQLEFQNIPSLFSNMELNLFSQHINVSKSSVGQDIIQQPLDQELMICLDYFNSDLHLEINKNGFEAKNLTIPSGFCFCWGGVKATYGVCRGKVMFEVRILEHLPTDFGEGHIETSPHVLRIGWSMNHTSLQLGEESDSWGYGGTGKFSTNNKFSDYGEPFAMGDVITAFLDLESKPASISFAKNGRWLGIASPLHGFKVDQKDHAMFPHILSKNCRFEVNFGQEESWCPVQYVNNAYNFINNIPSSYRVRGPKVPEQKSDCEVIMIVGLPGSGKTTWARKMFREKPEKMYNIIGTDDLIDKMKVMGLPRKNNYSGRWEVLIQQATNCLNKLFIIASRRHRHYIIDQTNVYASARRRKMKNFVGFKRICAVLQPEDDELKRREWKRTFEDGKVVPEEAVMEMKLNFSLPDPGLDEFVDEVIWIELEKQASTQLVTQYNEEASSRLPSRKRPTVDGGHGSDPHAIVNDARSDYFYGNRSNAFNQSSVNYNQQEDNNKMLKMNNSETWPPSRQQDFGRQQEPYMQQQQPQQQTQSLQQQNFHQRNQLSTQSLKQQQASPLHQQQQQSLLNMVVPPPSLLQSPPQQQQQKSLQQQQSSFYQQQQQDRSDVYKPDSSWDEKPSTYQQDDINLPSTFGTNVNSSKFSVPDFSLPPPVSMTTNTLSTTTNNRSTSSAAGYSYLDQQQPYSQQQQQHGPLLDSFKNEDDYNQSSRYDDQGGFSNNTFGQDNQQYRQQQQQQQYYDQYTSDYNTSNNDYNNSGVSDVKPFTEFNQFDMSGGPQKPDDERWQPRDTDYRNDRYQRRYEDDNDARWRRDRDGRDDERVDDRWRRDKRSREPSSQSSRRPLDDRRCNDSSRRSRRSGSRGRNDGRGGRDGQSNRGSSYRDGDSNRGSNYRDGDSNRGSSYRDGDSNRGSGYRDRSRGSYDDRSRRDGDRKLERGDNRNVDDGGSRYRDSRDGSRGGSNNNNEDSRGVRPPGTSDKSDNSRSQDNDNNTNYDNRSGVNVNNSNNNNDNNRATDSNSSGNNIGGNSNNRSVKTRWEPVNKSNDVTSNKSELPKQPPTQQQQPSSQQSRQPQQSPQQPQPQHPSPQQPHQQQPSPQQPPQRQPAQPQQSRQPQPNLLQQQRQQLPPPRQPAPQQPQARGSILGQPPPNISKSLLGMPPAPRQQPPQNNIFNKPSALPRAQGDSVMSSRAPPPLRGPRPMPPRIPPQLLQRQKF